MRDTLLYLGVKPLGLYTPQWSDRILNELSFNLVYKGEMDQPEADRLIALMRQHYPDAAVNPSTLLIESMTNHEKDRHVLAAAVQAHASILVTYNLSDFGAVDCDPYGVEVMDPRDFLAELYFTSPDDFVASLVSQVAAYEKPPTTMQGLLDTFGKRALEVVYNLEEDFGMAQLEVMLEDRRAEIREEQHERS